MKPIFLAAIIVSTVSRGIGAVALPSIFSDHMVVQHGVPLRIWGTADPDESVSVHVGETLIGATRADAAGRWVVTGGPQRPGALPDIVIRGTNTVTLKDVLAGEVWLCAGQSNMQMTVSPTPKCEYGGVINERAEVADASHPQIRFFDKQWEACSPETVGRASAVAYFFGRALQRELKVPVGLVTKAFGGTVVEYWLAPASWTKELTDKAVSAYVPFYQYRQQIHDQQVAKLQQAGAGNRPAAKPLAPPTKPEQYPQRFSKLFRDHLAPIAGYPIAGVLWYQGESNTPRSGAYQELLTALIEGWRTEWGNPELPFVIVQLADFATRETQGQGAENWPVLRDIQARVAEAVPRTALVVTLGAGDPDLLHPRNKQEVGRRAALRVLEEFYERNLLSKGPVLKSLAFQSGEVVLEFSGATEGMHVEGAEGLAMEIAGADRVFRAANSRIEGSTVHLSGVENSRPRWVRYAWAGYPRGLLMNREGLAAAPFEREIP